jgi:hypothetical protein
MRQIWYTGLAGGYLKSGSGYAGARRATGRSIPDIVFLLQQLAHEKERKT